jgi:hypothetical protein
VKEETESEAVLTQVSESQEPPEVGTGRQGPLLSLWRQPGAADILILDSELRR